MKAIIPMAGSGTRLRPLTHSKPKALLNVGSKPILSHITDILIPMGCDHLVLIISTEGERIPRFVRSHYPDLKVDVIIQEERLGLGHAVNLAENICRDGELIVMYGDTIIDGNFKGFIDRSSDAVIAVKEVEDPRRFGVVCVEKEKIVKFVEKPSDPVSNLAIVGFNYFRTPGILFDSLGELISGNFRTKGEFQITDAFQMMVERGSEMKAFTIDGWFDCGTPETLLETNRYMLKKESWSYKGHDSIIIPPVFVPESASISKSIIGPYVSVGEDAVIEKSIISDSIIGCGASVSYACLNGSLIGDDAQVSERPRRLTIGDNSSIDFDVYGD